MQDDSTSEPAKSEQVLTEATKTEQPKPAKKKSSSDANMLLGTGVGVGVYGTVMATATGIVCPACVVIAPALLGAGAYKKWREKKASE
jgi:hypothetical protein